MKGYDGLRFRAQDIDNEVYYQLPKSLFSYKFYEGLDIKAKVLYAVLKDRMNLSRKNGWVEAKRPLKKSIYNDNRGWMR